MKQPENEIAIDTHEVHGDTTHFVAVNDGDDYAHVGIGLSEAAAYRAAARRLRKLSGICNKRALKCAREGK